MAEIVVPSPISVPDKYQKVEVPGSVFDVRTLGHLAQALARSNGEECFVLSDRLAQIAVLLGDNESSPTDLLKSTLTLRFIRNFLNYMFHTATADYLADPGGPGYGHSNSYIVGRTQDIMVDLFAMGHILESPTPVSLSQNASENTALVISTALFGLQPGTTDRMDGFSLKNLERNMMYERDEDIIKQRPVFIHRGT